MKLGNRIGAILAAWLGLALTSSAAADVAPAGVPMSAELLDATVVEVDSSERVLTVRFEDIGETATFPVARGTQFYSYNGIQNVPVSLGQLTAGDPVELDFADLEPDTVLQRLESRS